MNSHLFHGSLFRSLVVGLAVGGGSSRPWAHDVPDRFFDRGVQVAIRTDRIHVIYHLNLTQLTLAEELLSLVGAGGLSGSGPKERLDRYASEMGPLLARGLLLKVDDQETPVRFVQASHRVEEHPRFQFQFEADLAGEPESLRHLALEETNFFLEKGSLRIAIRAEAPCQLGNCSVAAELEEVQTKASWEMTPEEQDATRRAQASWRVASPESGDQAAPVSSDAQRATGSVSAAQPSDRGASSPPSDTGVTATGSSAGETKGLIGLLDRHSRGLAIVLVALAFFFGAAHAMTPGHGKTMVAAYLVGERGTMRHAVGLGLATSLTHTGSVLAVAAVLAILGPALQRKMNTGLSLVSGLLVAGLGAGLLVARLRGQNRFSSNSLGQACAGPTPCEQHSPTNSTTSRAGGPSWPGMIALGVSGGIVPCWDAVALLLFAAAEGQVARALYLLVSFSAGLASALVSVGILAVKLRGYLSSRMGSGRIVQSLPVLSAAAILVVGIYLCVLTLQQPLGPGTVAAPSANRTAGL